MIIFEMNFTYVRLQNTAHVNPKHNRKQDVRNISLIKVQYADLELIPFLEIQNSQKTSGSAQKVIGRICIYNRQLKSRRKANR